MKQPDKKKNSSEKKISLPAGKNFDKYSIVILIYALVPLITPTFQAFDANGPKYLLWAVVNLFVFLFLLSGKESLIKSGKSMEFLVHPTGIMYCLFLVICLLSFIKALNIPETILMFGQMLTVFIAVFLIYSVLSKDKKYFGHLAIILTFVLMFDCLVLFGNIFLYVIGEINSISDIKSVYSNKNIFTAAIFIKLPFVIWLQVYGRSSWKKFCTVMLLAGFLAVLLLSTRAFYVGLTGLTFGYLSFLLICYFRKNEKNSLSLVFHFLGSLAVAVMIFYVIQGVFYSRKKEVFSENVVKRLETINISESSAKSRLNTWKFSSRLIHRDPLLGVGLGNWKVAELEYECPARDDFNYICKNHNDFIEVAAETGIPGGIVYLLLIFFPVILFIRSVFLPADKSFSSVLFLSAFGMFCYAFDAFFNFPLTRPEIQILFAFYVAAGMCVNPFKKEKEVKSSKILSWIFLSIVGILLVPLIVVLFNFFVSLRYQRIAHNEVESGVFSHSAEEMIAGFPLIPSINAGGEPIAVTKSRYLINEGKYQDAISLLRNDFSSPFDGRSELFMMYAYDRMGDKGKTMFYAGLVTKRKPLFYPATEKICLLQQESGDYISPIKTFSEVIRKNPENLSAHEYRARSYFLLKKFRDCIGDMNFVIKNDPQNCRLINIRGICYKELGVPDSACIDFTAALKLGCKEAKVNYAKVCEQQK